MSSTEPARAAIYLRVSGDDQRTETQWPEVEELCRARRWRMTGCYQEQASTRGDRPAFAAMMEAGRRGHFNVLAIWSVDRFGRSMFGNLRDVLQLERAGVRVVSVRESWLETDGPHRDLLLAILSWVAEQERERIRERTRAGLALARERGVHLGRPKKHCQPLLVRSLLASGIDASTAARRLGISVSTWHRVRQSTAAGRTKVHSDSGAM